MAQHHQKSKEQNVKSEHSAITEHSFTAQSMWAGSTGRFVEPSSTPRLIDSLYLAHLKYKFNFRNRPRMSLLNAH